MSGTHRDTPRHLADKIRQLRSSLEGERKQVTVLFADVKVSMELAEQLDPEAWSAIMQRFFAILAEGVERFEGFVDKFSGDGIMALFGAPLAHEHHARRACYAALHLRDRLRHHSDELRIDPGVNFSFRLGLNSGEVIYEEGDELLERARTLMSTSSAGREWPALIDGFQAICLILAYLGSVWARVLRMVSGRQREDDLAAQITETLELIQRRDIKAYFPFLLLERAGLAPLRGDADGMTRDLAEARRLFAEMGVTGWDDYTRSIEA